MGLCVSVQKDSEPAVELHLPDGPKTEKPLTAAAEKQEVDAVSGVDHAVADLETKSGFSSRFRQAVSKDEAFFDSQPWLESDCEDDFVSINGDFTPSRGSTPVHHKFSSGNSTATNASVMENASELSSLDKKKRLSELFKESLRRQDYTNEEEETKLENAKDEGTNTQVLDESSDGVEAKPMVSSGEQIPDLLMGADEESVESTQCCLPSFGDRKRKTRPVLINGSPQSHKTMYGG